MRWDILTTFLIPWTMHSFVMCFNGIKRLWNTLIVNGQTFIGVKMFTVNIQMHIQHGTLKSCFRLRGGGSRCRVVLVNEPVWNWGWTLPGIQEHCCITQIVLAHVCGLITNPPTHAHTQTHTNARTAKHTHTHRHSHILYARMRTHMHVHAHTHRGERDLMFVYLINISLIALYAH